MDEKAPTYIVIDRQTKAIMGRYATLKRASSRANKLDLAYGAVRYTVRRAQAGE